MNTWQVLEWVAWALSALMIGWMLLDAWRVSQQFSEETLMSSREGVDDLFGGDDKSKGA
jgi:hypothetical protein